MPAFIFLLLFVTAFGEVVHFENNRWKYTIKRLEKPVLHLSWVRLSEGGYMISGDISQALSKEKYCKYLTDFSVEEIKKAIKTGGVSPFFYVKSINAVAVPNDKPFLANPYRPNINPTVTTDIYEINSYLKKEVKKAIKTDSNVAEYYSRQLEYFIQSGLSEEKAKKKALMMTAGVIKLSIKKWIPEKKLPKKLFLVCRSDREEFHTVYTLYPVRLTVKTGKSIQIQSVEKTDREIKISVRLFPAVNPEKNRYFAVDVITVSPVKLKSKNCPYPYFAFIPYGGKNRYRQDYQVSLQPVDGGFYLVFTPFKVLGSIDIYGRLGIYCSDRKMEKVSMLNPEKNHKASLNNLIRQDYTHSKFLSKIKQKQVNIKVRIVSSDGYSSEVFTLHIP